MTIDTLLAKLSMMVGQGVRPDTPVIMARDEEGNGFHSVAQVESAKMDKDGNSLHPDDWDENSVPCVTLWPS